MTHAEVAAIDTQIGAGDKGSIVAAEEQDGPGYFDRFSASAQHMKLAPNRFPAGTIAAGQPIDLRRPHRTWTDAVDSNAHWCQVQRLATRQGEDGAFGRVVGPAT